MACWSHDETTAAARTSTEGVGELLRCCCWWSFKLDSVSWWDAREYPLCGVPWRAGCGENLETRRSPTRILTLLLTVMLWTTSRRSSSHNSNNICYPTRPVNKNRHRMRKQLHKSKPTSLAIKTMRMEILRLVRPTGIKATITDHSGFCRRKSCPCYSFSMRPSSCTTSSRFP